MAIYNDTVLAPSGRPATLADVLSVQAKTRPNDIAIRFIEPRGLSLDDAVADSLTFSDLDRLAKRVASRLISLTDAGDRILLLCPPGFDYVAALFGCFYSGLVAVPAYPPMSQNVDERVRQICNDSKPRVVVTTQLLASSCEASDLSAADGTAVPTVILDQSNSQMNNEQGQFRASVNDLALLQYTSGSTGQPRGVMLSHANILANIESIITHADGSSADRGVFWLPPYHDMGLIGGIFTPIVLGAETTLMSPLSFLADPTLWLDAVTRYRGTFAAAPNFAYDLCVRKASDSRIRNLDLSSWRIAINGAEPVQPATVERFVERFTSAGFRCTSFMPCYGLAEATLLVTGTQVGGGIKATHLDSQGYGDHTVSDIPLYQGEVISSGVPAESGAVVVVDADQRLCKDGDIGEIWFQGPSVASGYWGAEEASQETFQAVLADRPDRGIFLRTGDLGTWSDGELYVTGRVKDIIIVRGQNYYPHDIERTINLADARLRPGCIAVFAVQNGQGQKIVAVAESLSLDTMNEEEMARKVRAAVAQEYGLSLAELVLIERGTSLKTSSGKIRRRPTRDAYLKGELVGATLARPDESSGQAQPESDMQTTLTIAMAEILDVESASPDEDFLAMGADSLNVVELTAIAGEQGVAIEPSDVYRFPTARLLSEEIGKRAVNGWSILGEGTTTALIEVLRGEIPPVADAVSYPLSPIQRRWAADYLVDRSKTWGNLSIRLALPDGGNPISLEAVVARVWSAHESLRTVFPDDEDHTQRVLPSVSVPISEHDLTHLSSEEQVAQTARIAAAEAGSIFDLATGPSARLALVRTAKSVSEIILTIHHMLADGWSLLKLREQLAAAYDDAIGATTSVKISPPSVRYRDYAVWMNRLESGGALSDARRYWLKELDGDLPITLPVNEGAARGTETKGASQLAVLPSELSASLKELAITTRYSISAWLLGAFFLTIQRCTGSRDVIIGTPLAGRDRRDIKNVIGMFINLVPVRIRFRRDWELRDVVAATHEKLIGAVTYQRYQLDNMMNDLGIEREPHRFAVTNTFFTRMGMGKQTLGAQTGSSVASDLAIDVRYQMMLYAYDFADGLVIDCRYRKALFERADVKALVDDYITILTEAVLA